jgi:hypothetical protein
VPRLPADAYERFRANPLLTPGMRFNQRADNDRKSFPSDRSFWETVVPVRRFAGGRLAGLEIHPVTSGSAASAIRAAVPGLRSETKAAASSTASPHSQSRSARALRSAWRPRRWRREREMLPVI